jgi:hypothetical protein
MVENPGIIGVDLDDQKWLVFLNAPAGALEDQEFSPFDVDLDELRKNVMPLGEAVEVDGVDFNTILREGADRVLGADAGEVAGLSSHALSADVDKNRLARAIADGLGVDDYVRDPVAGEHPMEVPANAWARLKRVDPASHSIFDLPRHHHREQPDV